MKFKLNVLPTLIMATCFTFASAQASLVHAQSIQKTRLSTEELQWVLEISDEKWSDEMQSIARLFEDEQYAAADAVMDSWLTRDFNQAMFILSEMDFFVFHFKEHSLSPVFAKHLRQFNGPERIKILSALNLNNDGVRIPAVYVVKSWWQEDQAGMTKWLQATPSFLDLSFLQEVLDELIGSENDSVNINNFPALAKVFYSFDESDDRRLTLFNLVIEQWVKIDLQATTDFILDLHNAREDRMDVTLDTAIATLAYQYTYSENYTKALQLASRIKNAEIREWRVRDYSSNVSKADNKQLFLAWMKDHPFENTEAREQILEHFNTIGVDTIDGGDN